jgi:tetratricopeptide (TPR) repeat protein
MKVAVIVPSAKLKHVVQVMAYKAEALLKLHKPEEADSVISSAKRFEETLKRSALAQTYSLVLLVQAQVDMALGRFDSAVVAAEKASEIAPNDVTVTVLLRKARTVAKARKVGNDLFKAGRFSEAVIAYGEGLESSPGNAVLLCNRAACRSKLNQWEKAVEDSNAALEAQPNYTKALLRRAQSNAKMERWEDALRDYEVLRREVPGDAEVARALSTFKSL